MSDGLEITIGDVFYLRCTLCNPPNPKFFVVAQPNPLRMFLINSEMTAFAKARPAHAMANAPILLADHPEFLTHDSFVGCDHVSHEYSRERLIKELERNPSVARGRLHAHAVVAVAEALRHNDLLPRKYLRELKPSWFDAAGLT